MNNIKLKHFFLALMALCLCAWASADTYSYDKLNRLTAVAYTSGGSQTYSYDPAGNLTALVNAPPAVSDYTLVVNLSGHGSGTVTGSGINCGTLCNASFASGTTVTLTANPGTGAAFTGWGGACSGSSTCVLSMTASVNVTAEFASNSTPVSATLSVTRNGSGSGSVSSVPAGIDCGATCSATFDSNTSVTLSATPGTDSTFVGWGGDCSGSASCTLTMAAAKNVSASFTSSAGAGNLSYVLMLAQGWNLLGNSLNDSLNVATLFGNPAVVNTVWKWDAANAGWQFYAPSLDAPALQSYAISKGYSVLSVINPGDGFWVNAKAPTNLGQQSGTAFSLTSASLVKDWNLVATGQDVSPSDFNKSLSAVVPVGLVPINLTTLWAWDSAGSKWYFYAPTLEASGGLGAYTVSKDYLDFSATGKTLGNGTGFWVRRP